VSQFLKICRETRQRCCLETLEFIVQVHALFFILFIKCVMFTYMLSVCVRRN